MRFTKTLVLAVLSLASIQAFAWDNIGAYTGVAGGLSGVLSSMSRTSQANDPYNRSGGSYSRGETLRKGQVEDAVVLDVQEVTQESTTTAATVGTTAGGAIGGVAGATLGKNNATRAIGGIVGAVVGSMAGQEAGRYVSERKAGEVLIQLSNGKRTFVVQEDGLSFQPGDKVFVFGSTTGNIRIKPNKSGVTADTENRAVGWR